FLLFPILKSPFKICVYLFKSIPKNVSTLLGYMQNQLNAPEGRRPDLYHVDHVSLILYEGMLHRADGGYVSGKNEYEKIIDKNDSKKRQNVDEQQSEFLLC
ncbi:MAG: hypothetical protein E6869_10645, partial [Enterococcus hirae]|nr:hypothetical protein [Enterococcus hirae]